MQIDAHQHFWQLDRGDYGWLTPALAPIYRDFLPSDLAPMLARHGIDKTILVQAAPTMAETDYLLDLTEQSPFVAGVVGWIDLTAPDAPRTIAQRAANARLVGLRPMVHDIADDNWLLRPDLAPAITAMVTHGLVFDALVRPRHLRTLRSLMARHPDLDVVIDHGAKPGIARGSLEPWLSDLRVLADNPRVTCKLSGLVTEAARNWRPDDVLPYCAHLLALFGPERVIWGSDWPVVELAGGYDGWRALSLQALQDLTPAAHAAVLGGNAARVYFGRGRGDA